MTLGDKYNTLSPILKMWLLRLREVNTFLKATQLIVGISITVECVFLSSKAGLSQNLKPYISILPFFLKKSMNNEDNSYFQVCVQTLQIL